MTSLITCFHTRIGEHYHKDKRSCGFENKSCELDAISKLKLDLHAFKINLLVEGLLTEGDEVQGMVHHFSSPAKKTHIH